VGEGRNEATEPAGTPAPPDALPVNEAWPAEPAPARGLSAALERFLLRALGPRFAAQREFNARQVRLDNETLAYFELRLAATHRHYDRLLGDLGRRLDEADERHRSLERELVRHVQDLVRRIDLVLLESNREQLSLVQALADARERLARLERAEKREG
jgi:hypothetical protein